MKRLSRWQRERHGRLARKRDKRRKKELLARRRWKSARPVRVGPGFVPDHIPDGAKRVLAPRRFNIRNRYWRTQLLKFLRRMRDIAVTQGRQVFVDFHETEQLGPGGTLLFLAEIDRIKRANSPKQIFSCNYPLNPIVEQVLQQVGILDVLGRKSRLNESDFDETVRHWRFATGNSVDGKQVEPFVGPLDGRLAAPLTSGLFVGVTEAMTNCIQHAYLERREDGIDSGLELRRWWMFSQEKGGNLEVAFCDLGMGIPRSLQVSGEWNESIISSVLNRLGLIGQRSDSALIRASVELRKTRTHLSHRGKGLTQILDVVRAGNSGSLQIYSNYGMFNYDARTKKEYREDFAHSISGTLILWDIPLPQETRSQLPLPLGDRT